MSQSRPKNWLISSLPPDARDEENLKTDNDNDNDDAEKKVDTTTTQDDKTQPNQSNSSSSSSNNDTNNDVNPNLGDLWDSLQREFTNMGRALTCPLCLSTYKDAVVLPCVHAYCSSCLKEAFSHAGPNSNNSRCPTCLTKANRRSMASAPVLNSMCRAYKLALRHFGLAPVQYDPSYNAMTQIAPGESISITGSSNIFGGGGGGLTMEPYVVQSNKARRKSSNLIESHAQLLVSRTWQKVLQERQEAQLLEAESAPHTRPTSKPKSKVTNKQTAKAVKVAVNTSKNSGNMIPNSSNIHVWYQQQQASVIASHERALIDAAKERLKLPTPTSSQISLSVQHELVVQDNLEQQLANADMEEEEKEGWTCLSNKSEEIMNDTQRPEKQDTNNYDKPVATVAAGKTKTTAELPPAVNIAVTSNNSTNNDNDNDNNIGQKTIQEKVDVASGSNADNFVVAAVSGETKDICTDSHHPVTADTAVNTMLDSKPPALTNVRNPTANQEGRKGNPTKGAEDPNPVVGEDSDDDTTVGENMETEGYHRKTCFDDPHRDVEVPMCQPSQANSFAKIAHQENNCNADLHGKPHVTATLQRSDTTATAPNLPSAAPSVAAAADPATASTHTTNKETTSPVGSATNMFQVGDIVQVQSRTWPGVNKPGGIARITEVFPETSSYSVVYILGGREKNVDGLFISSPPEEMVEEEEEDDTDETAADHDTKLDSSFSSTASSRERKSRRILKHQQQQIASPAKNLGVSLELVQQLKEEGFDVTPRADTGSVASSFATECGRSKCSRVRFKEEPTERSKSKSQSYQPCVAGRQRHSEYSGRPRKETAVLQNSTADQQGRKDAQKRNAPGVASNSVSKKIAKKRRKIADSQVAPAVTSSGPPPQLPSSTNEICALANSHYRRRVQSALESSVVTVVASTLTEKDKAALKSLCKISRESGNVQLKVSDVFHANKTALCLVPAMSTKDDPSNLVGQCRTLKAMRSAIAGVPLVSSSWIQACRDANKIVLPSDSMWVRSLPLRSSVEENVAASQYGLSKIAAQATYRANQILRNTTVQLCGAFSRPPKADMHILLREAGATLSLQTTSTVAAMKNLDATPDRKLVLICDDACTAISEAIQRHVKAALQDDNQQQMKHQVLVVNPQWLFDSIVIGKPMSGRAYPPAKKQPLDLWQLLYP